MKKDKYLINNLDLSLIRNRNEVRVVKEIRILMEELPDYEFSNIMIQDIYATALNALPSRYTQAGTIVLRDAVTQKEIEKTVRNAFSFVINHPN